MHSQESFYETSRLNTTSFGNLEDSQWLPNAPIEFVSSYWSALQDLDGDSSQEEQEEQEEEKKVDDVEKEEEEEEEEEEEDRCWSLPAFWRLAVSNVQWQVAK